MARTRALTVVLVAASVCAAQTNTHDFLGLGAAPDAAAAKRGEPLYTENCATCHGKAARGAQGPNLVRSPLVLHDEKGAEIGQVIHNGRSENGMPAFPNLSPAQTYDIAQFIHLQVELAANRGTYRDTYGNLRNQVTGDAVKGREFYEEHCTGCHSVDKDLAGVGTRYPQPPVLLSRIAWPISSTPEHATVTTASGEKIDGVLTKYDDFDVALKGDSGEYHSWPRAEVKVDIPDKLAGHRALLPMYTDADLHNLTAYLVALK